MGFVKVGEELVEVLSPFHEPLEAFRRRLEFVAFLREGIGTVSSFARPMRGDGGEGLIVWGESLDLVLASSVHASSFSS